VCARTYTESKRPRSPRLQVVESGGADVLNSNPYNPASASAPGSPAAQPPELTLPPRFAPPRPDHCAIVHTAGVTTDTVIDLIGVIGTHVLAHLLPERRSAPTPG
jgi:hypothetical protein